MKVVILAGGLGSRLQEETTIIPKPMVSIGDKPILHHIMKIYYHWGLTDFVICLGYKGYVIKEYFANYFLHHSDVTFDFTCGSNQMIIHQKQVEPWKVTLADTGPNTQTGGRILRIRPYIDEEVFMLTYGDGVSDVNIKHLLEFHKTHGKIATLTAARPPGKFGVVQLDGTRVKKFQEKPIVDGGWINGGFFVLNSKVFDYLEGDQTVWEWEPLENLARAGELEAYQHQGFWKCMDTLRDKNELNEMWNSGHAPWKVWEDVN